MKRVGVEDGRLTSRVCDMAPKMSAISLQSLYGTLLVEPQVCWGVDDASDL
jgi:hypothetical protein